MKKTISAFFIMVVVSLFGFQSFAQQGQFRGIVKYALTWEGEVPQGAPTSFEMKVYDNKTIFDDMFAGCKIITNAENKTTYSMFDFSQVPVEGVTGKWYIKSKLEDKDFANITYEPTSETKEIAGRKVKKVNVTMKSDDGKEEKEVIWVSEDFGPTMDLRSYPGLKAMAFEFPVDLQKFKVNFKVSEIIEGKVKEADMLLPVGFEEVTAEEFKEIINILMEAMGGGASDDI